MTTTDQQVLQEIQGHLLESQNSGASWSSGFWTVSEVTDYLNQRQRSFLRDTLLLLTPVELATVPGTLRQNLPTDWIATADVCFKSSDSPPAFQEVPRSDEREADLAIPTWQLELGPTPLIFTEAELPTLQIQIAPATQAGGTLLLLYVAISAALSNSGVNFTVPDEFVPPVKWGVVADMLSKVGRAQDPTRAAWAQSKYVEGVEAARLLLQGFSP